MLGPASLPHHESSTMTASVIADLLAAGHSPSFQLPEQLPEQQGAHHEFGPSNSA